MFTEKQQQPSTLPRRFRQGQPRYRGLRARAGPAPAGYCGHHSAAGQPDRPRDGTPRFSRYLAGPLVPTMFRPRRATAVVCTSRMRWGALEACGDGRQGRPRSTLVPTASSCCRRRSGRAGRIPVPVPGIGVWALDSLRRANRYKRDQPRPVRLPKLRPGDGHHQKCVSELGYQPKWSTAQSVLTTTFAGEA